MATDQDTQDATPRPKNYGKRRAAVLFSVYVFMALHIAHWKIAGETLAPLELNEVMYTLELGIVTAGFLLMLAAVVSVMIFGRFFCSWGCHILALEDLCFWMLSKAGIKPKPVRSRILLFVPPLALFYMFVWPQLTRLWTGGKVAAAHVVDSEGEWASFVTDDFWRNLPGPWIALLTFAIAGFAIVYVLGSRAFCTYGCPYGALFALADRVSPGRIVANDDCDQCGRCTAVCTSDILVHKEIREHKNIVDPACMKDLDCVAECPKNALSFGFTKPPLFTGAKAARKGRRFDFSVGEEVLMGICMIACIAIFRFLYNAVPFLATLAIGAIIAFGTVIMLRLMTRKRVSLRGVALKKNNVWTAAGAKFLGLALPIAILVVHSGFIRYHEVSGDAAFEEFVAARSDRRSADYQRLYPIAAGHLESAHEYGIVQPISLSRRLAALHYRGPDPSAAIPYLQEVLESEPADIDARLHLAYIAIQAGDVSRASQEIERALAHVNETEGDAVALTEQIARAMEVLAKTLTRLSRENEANAFRARAAELRAAQ